MNKEQINRFNRNMSLGKFGNKVTILPKMKEWCKQNPGKKALIVGTTAPSQMLTYYPGAKAFIYSPVKSPLEPTVAIDEVYNKWLTQQWYADDITEFKENHLKELLKRSTTL